MENALRYFFRQLTLILEDDMMSFAVAQEEQNGSGGQI